MATRKSRRIRGKKSALRSLDAFKHDGDDSDGGMSDSPKNAHDDEVSSADSASSDYEEEEEEGVGSESDDESAADSESEGDSNSESAASSSPDESENDRSSDSDYDPTARKKKKRAAPKKRRAPPKKKRNRRQSVSESDDASNSDSDGEYRPRGASSRSRSKQSESAASVGSRRSTRNLGRERKKYDDRSIYGEVEGLYDDDGKERENKRKEYRTVARKRVRGGIKTLSAKGGGARNGSKSASQSPGSKKRLRLTLKRKAASAGSKEEESSSDSAASGADGTAALRVDGSSSSSGKSLPYTYSSWLDDVVSDTECKYSTRGRLHQCTVNHVEYHIQVQTECGLEDFKEEEGRIRPSANKRGQGMDHGMDHGMGHGMDVDSGDDSERAWYQKLKIGDPVECLLDGSSWTECTVTFINRLFCVQYFFRRNINKEQLWEFKPGTQRINDELRTRLRPSVDVEETPEPESVAVSPGKRPRAKKKQRFGDSDDSEDDAYSEQDSVAGDGLEIDSRRQSLSVSPVDDLVTKIESILFKMKVPRSTVHWKATFDHLMATVTAPAADKMEVDDEDKENVPAAGSDGDGSAAPAAAAAAAADNKLVTKYLCKFTNKSYHHLEWLTLPQLIEVEAEMKARNFNKKWNEHDRHVTKVNTAVSLGKYALALTYFFNELYLEIDRIISYSEPGETFDSVAGYTSSVKQFQINVNTSAETMYLVKWRGMEYDEATWELESFLKADAFDAKYHGTEEMELLLSRQKVPEQRLLHPSPGRLNKTHFINRSATEHRVEDGQVFKGGRKLRGEYQRDGVNWLLNNWQGRRGCILADEMGLGKTVQTVTFVNYLWTHYRQWGPFLVVAPLSTLGHWQREFRAWSDLNVIVYHGSMSSRERIQTEEFQWLWTDPSSPRARNEAELKKLNANNFKFNVMITTPQTVNGDQKVLSAAKIPWNTIIVDEAHSLKSNKSLFYRILNTFRNPHSHTVFLTGTPIQNNMDELWCLLHFLDPLQFDDQNAFVTKFSNLAESRDELKAILKGRLLQRLKYLVESSLGHREEKIIWVELTLFQKKWYKALYQKSYDKLKACGSKKASLMNVSMQLRKCCNHPFLMEGVEGTISPPGTNEDDVNLNLVRSCGKFVLLDKLLPKLQREGHRVLIFSQMSHLLDIMEDYLNYRRYLYERLDGSVTGIARQEAIDRFQRDDSIFAFLLTTKAGGVGITLTKADTVIIYDSDWNPMNDVQAIARSHRIGQTKQVTVYRLLTRNSYEENMFKRADRKLALNKAVMGDSKDVKKSDLDKMLKQGAISMFLQDAQTDADIKKFADASIDDILAKRTEVVTHDADTANPDNAMFSEAVFLAHADDADVNVDDENFWERIGIAPDDDEEDAFASPMRRRGRRTRFGAQTAVEMYDSDGYSLSGEPVDEGTSLLGALSYIVYGNWQQIFDDLSNEEKAALAIEHKDDAPDPAASAADDNPPAAGTAAEQQDDDGEAAGAAVAAKKTHSDEKSEENYVPPPPDPAAAASSAFRPIEEWQTERLRKAAVETICRMLNLMRPEVKLQKLGKNFVKIQSLMHDEDFRRDAIHTLALQIWKQDIVDSKSEGWKDMVVEQWKARDLKNRFVDKLQLKRRPNLCQMGCGRLRNPEQREPHQTHSACCRSCGAKNDDAAKEGGKDSKDSGKVHHDLLCDRRHHKDWRKQIRAEAVKTFLRRHPLQRADLETEEKADSVPDPQSARYEIPRPKEKELVAAIAEELSYHDTIRIVSAMHFLSIDHNALKDELRKKTHGNILELLVKMEKMMKFKAMCSTAAGGELSSLDFSKNKVVKAMPEWWSAEFTHCLVDGTMRFGWASVPAHFARDHYGFTPTFKGQRKLTKKERDERKRLEAMQKAMDNVQIDGDGQSAAPRTGSASASVSVPSSPDIIVKKRQWISDKTQEVILCSVMNNFRKPISERIRASKDALKRANKERERRVHGVGPTAAEKEAAKKKEERKRAKKEKKERKERKQREKEERRARKKGATAVSAEFAQQNDIKNYFRSSLQNMPSGTRNAFDILGKSDGAAPPKKKEEKEGVAAAPDRLRRRGPF